VRIKSRSSGGGIQKKRVIVLGTGRREWVMGVFGSIVLEETNVRNPQSVRIGAYML
jgi:hypothetical protein